MYPLLKTLIFQCHASSYGGSKPLFLVGVVLLGIVRRAITWRHQKVKDWFVVELAGSTFAAMASHSHAVLQGGCLGCSSSSIAPYFFQYRGPTILANVCFEYLSHIPPLSGCPYKARSIGSSLLGSCTWSWRTLRKKCPPVKQHPMWLICQKSSNYILVGGFNPSEKY